MLRFTLYGLSQYDPHLFDNVILPSELDKDICINNILNKSGDLFLYYQVAERAKKQIEDWFEMHYLGFERMIQALLMEYNPIENTDRYEDESLTADTTSQNKASGSDNTQASGSDNTQASGKDTVTTDNESKVSAFDSSTYQPKEKFDGEEETAYGRKDTSTYGRKDTMTYGRIDDGKSNSATHRVLHTHGNIGTLTNQSMVEAELELRIYNIYDVIAVMFEHDILVQLY